MNYVNLFDLIEFYCNRATAYILGNAGVLVIACLIFNSLNDIKKRDHFSDCYSHLAEQVLPVSYLKRGNHFIFYF